MDAIGKDLFKAVEPKRTFEDISNQIKHLIYSGQLKPGDRLPSERELAIQFNTGRMSLREALRILEESSFIRVKTGIDGGIYVKELDETGISKSILDLLKVGHIDVDEIAELRFALESFILESGIKKRTKKQLSALKNNIVACEEILARSSTDIRYDIDEKLFKFHSILADISKNRMHKYLFNAIMSLYVDVFKKNTLELSFFQDHVKQHRMIYEALESKDLKAAQKAIKSHIMSAKDRIEKYSLPMVDLIS